MVSLSQVVAEPCFSFLNLQSIKPLIILAKGFRNPFLCVLFSGDPDVMGGLIASEILVASSPTRLFA